MRQEALLNSHRIGRNLQQPDINAQFPLRVGIIDGLLRVLESTPRQTIVGALLITSLLAFELFNFDTTQYALGDLLGETSFMNIRWATILAVAFCAIDFAGLTYLFGPDGSSQNQLEIWYLMGAWLLGATMNALMSWWAVSLSLLDLQNGNIILSHEQLLDIVPMLVAVLVWVTRILFIGAFSIAGSRMVGPGNDTSFVSRHSKTRDQHRSTATGQAATISGGNRHTNAGHPDYGRRDERIPKASAAQATRANSRPKSTGYSTRVSRRSSRQARRQRSPMLVRSPRRVGR
jgi:hypothetical protein